MKIKSKALGFTLIELLVTFAILSLLASVAFGQYRTSQMKALDSRRKSDLGNIARSLEMYYNDNAAYPVTDGGVMRVEQESGDVSLDWGTEFTTAEVIYMKVLPQDPHSDNGVDYCYDSDDGTYYRIYAMLENDQDMDFVDVDENGVGDYTCVGVPGYSYGLSSSNVAVDQSL